MQPTFQLDKTGRALFETFINYLEERGQLDAVDLHFVTEAAAIGARVEEYERKVKKNGAIAEYSNGTTGFSAEYKVLVQERSHFAQYCRALGITPAGREAAKMRGTSKRSNPAVLGLIKIAK